MAKNKEPINPFYVLLVILGVVFFITAVSYSQMARRAIAPLEGQAAAPHPLMTFLDLHGMQLLIGELVLLAIATCGAMGLDQFRSWQKDPKDSDNGAKTRSETDTKQNGKIR